jgi:hypothetical protein
MYGRRIYIIYAILLLSTFFEIAIAVLSFRTQEKFMIVFKYLFFFKATFVYLLYLMVCQFGIVDITKEEMLKQNFTLSGTLICLVIASQQIINALIFERYMKQII